MGRTLAMNSDACMLAPRPVTGVTGAKVPALCKPSNGASEPKTSHFWRVCSRASRSVARSALQQVPVDVERGAGAGVTGKP